MEENIKAALELIEKSADLFEQAQAIFANYGIQFLTPAQSMYAPPSGDAKYGASLLSGINKLAESCGMTAAHPVDYWKQEQEDRLAITYGNIFIFQTGKLASKEYVFK